MRLLTIFCSTCVLMSLTSCSEDPVDFKDYYFPYDNMMSAHSYYYVSDQEDTLVWKMQYYPKEKYFLTLGYFNGEFIERVNEQITSTGARMVTYDQKLGGEMIDGEVGDDEIVNWEIHEADNFIWDFTYVYEDPEEQVDGLVITQELQKSRQLIGEGNDFKWKGEALSTYVFKDEFKRTYTFNHHYDDFETEYYFESTYAKGLGLVKYIGHFEDNTTVEWTLFKIEKEGDKFQAWVK